ncbi:MAG: peptide chain release factor N(5)-glutamine methyltransferase [Chloroflexi bacterium]|nr:peptide chain release factor N(5)-glutamine methyltransferase [Chloroflexota bacterium]
MTVARAIAWGRGVLSSYEFTERSKDCEILMAYAAGRERSWITLNRHRPLATREFEVFRSLVFECAAGTPVQYLVGATEFFGLELKVERGVYLPKWETELLVEEALGFLETPQQSDLTWGRSLTRAVIHEVGTGSGAIAISIAMHAPFAEISASDVSAFALSLARSNSRLNGVAGQIRFCHGDLQDPLAGVPDLVVANLPYIREMEVSNLPTNVRAQPRTSLLSRRSGLEHVNRLLEKLTIKPGGKVLLEIGFDQARDLQSHCSGIPKLSYERTVKDLAGFDRVAVITAL